MKKILAVILMLFMVLHPMPFAAAAEEAMQEHEKELSENVAPVTEESTEEAFPGGPEQVLENPTGAAETDAVPEPEEPNAASAPTKMWLEPSERNGIPSQIDVFVSKTQTGGTTSNRTYTYTCQLYLPGNAVPDNCFLSWDGGMQATVGNSTADSGSCPIPAVGSEQSFSFRVGSATYVYRMTTLQGSAGVTPVFIEIDESNGNPTIAQMDGDADHNVTCTGDIWIDGMKYELSKIKGRGNATWKESDDKKPYNVTLGKKIYFPGVDSEKTKKWSFLAENLDRSLLGNRAGYWLAYEMGIGQDTASADVWMNGEYQGCYTVTPKTDSYVTKTGYMIEQDNYLEASVADGGDPQFQLDGLKESSGWSSAYNRITVKKMGDDLLGYDANGEVNESAENMEAAAKRIQAWLQDAWDAIRSDTGYNAKGKYYTDYIDIESFAKMYLMHEYVKSYDVCAGSILYHRDGQTDDDKLIAGPLWDLDNAMGSTYNNSSLGRGSDRRSGQGSFIPIITEYKTSVYKTISKHSDFMEEVYRQYNRYRSRFDALSDDFNEMAQEIESSALMNFRKVNDLGNGTGKNNHYYGSQYTTGSGQYAQTYVKTTQWQDYVTNMDTYITTRSLWFYNTYYDSSYVCEHQYRAAVTDPTCKAEGAVVYSCIYCGDSYTESLPKIAHDYQNGVCTGCGEVLLTAAVVCGTGASVTVYETQDTGGACMENAVSAHPRNSDTGMIDCGGGGQINFAVTLAPGYELTAVTAEPASAYKNLKGPADTGVENGYRLTEVKGDLTITVTAQCTHDYQAVVTLPTCTEDGHTTWTCRYCGDSYVDAIVPAMGHAWGIAAYEWAEDNGSVTATRVCAHDAAHVETETVKTTSEVTKPAACEEKGETTYTAVFANKAFEPQTKAVEDIPAIGHTPGETVKENEREVTCTADGSYDVVVYCSVCHGELNRETKMIPAIGHAWGEPTYAWADDNGSVTATRICAHDTAHVETETVKTTSVTTAATCETAGKTTYTATFENEAFETQTKEVVIPVLGHAWGEPTWTWAEDHSGATATFTCANDPDHTETVTAAVTSETTAATA
ncbi:MAG: CotH kinase family protein, partial [Oscillospiraceae bacterium]|nr:CotH kinase family protein [Oscillospiraceae bacterium]